jgi:carbonic anhydrase
VIVQLDHLRTHPAVAEALNAGRIRLHGWVYHIATGEVTAYNTDWREFVAL